MPVVIAQLHGGGSGGHLIIVAMVAAVTGAGWLAYLGVSKTTRASQGRERPRPDHHEDDPGERRR